MRKRNLYRRPKTDARTRGTLRDAPPPIGMPNASVKEVATALACACWCMQDDAGNHVPVEIGRCHGYDPIKNSYTVLAKNHATGRVGDFNVEGEVVVELITLARIQNGGPLDARELIKSV